MKKIKIQLKDCYRESDNYINISAFIIVFSAVASLLTFIQVPKLFDRGFMENNRNFISFEQITTIKCTNNPIIPYKRMTIEYKKNKFVIFKVYNKKYDEVKKFIEFYGNIKFVEYQYLV